MGRGGAREGAGRKALVPGEKRVQVSISVSPETVRRIDDLRKKNVRVGPLVDELIRKYCEDNV